MAFAPSFWRVSSAVPVLEHDDGMLGNPRSSITCTGTRLASSPASLTSAVWTGPHVNPSRNWAHSTSGAPFDPTCCGRDSVRTLPRTRNPVDPVSTSTPSIVWQPVV